jgi:type II secretory pathway predicted ATPase ExeA
MYRSYWNLRGDPFTGPLAPRRLLASTTHDEALARLTFLVEEGRRLGLLLGAAGSGKSSVLRKVAEDLRRSGQCVVRFSLAGADEQEFLWQTATGLGLAPDQYLPVFQLWRLVTDGLSELRYQQVQTVLCLDDAEQAAPEVLTMVARIANGGPATEKRISIILAAESSGVSRLGPRLLEMADLKVEVEPWDKSETTEYVRQALLEAGGNPDAFGEGALSRIFELTGGIPRRVNQLADLAMLAGAGQNAQQIDAELVDAAHDELSVGQWS